MSATPRETSNEPSAPNMNLGEDDDSISHRLNYKIRYVELTRPISGFFIGGVYYGVTHTTDLTDTSFIMATTTIANLLGWVAGEHIIHRCCIHFNLYKKTNTKNPLFRNFKTLASLGASIGATVASFDPIFLLDRKLAVSIFSIVGSLLLGLAAFLLRWYRQSGSSLPENEENMDAQVGVEGWSKYSKLALTLGTSIGQCIGASISYAGGYNTINAWSTITLYSAIGSIVSFVAVAILVPVINYVTRIRYETGAGILIVRDRDIFNSNYIRSGMTLGVAVGTVLGGLVGPLVITGLSASIGIALCAGIFSILMGITLGLYGQKLSFFFQRNWGVMVDTDNSWSYASRNMSTVFGLIGSAIACILFPGAALLQSVAIGSAIFNIIGWFVGLAVIRVARKIEPDEEKTKPGNLPWTQRISTGANRGLIIGAAFGLVLALTLFAGSPLGLIGWVTLVGSLGGILGGLIEGFEDAVAKRVVRNVLFGEASHSSATSKASSYSSNRNLLFAPRESPRQESPDLLNPCSGCL